jgi:DNA-binding MarR family transcriptional regulator
MRGRSPAFSTPLDERALYHLGGHLGVVHRRIQRADEALLASHQLSPAQARAIRTLARAGQPMQMGELATRLDVVPRSATSVVDELEPLGLVTRQREPNDGRRVLVSLTDRGGALAPQLVDIHGSAVASVLGELTATEVRTLAILLDRVAHGPAHA